ncbi:MAG: bifunctional 4-hydroxy-2-oxoglutarate aldolase/2-dehydro-3-deoxy-phosphogluconate aldolase [Cyanobacteria bacterium P01_H01_bin.74]
MTMMETSLNQIKHSKIIAVIRTHSFEDALWSCETLIEAGIQAIEITMTTPNACELISICRKHYPNCLVGAGTVLSTDMAITCINAGAQFMVSPATSPECIDFAKQKDILFIPGCATPTEIYQAMQLDAAAIKLFPIIPLGGVKLLKAIRGPFPDVLIIPTGGVTIEDAVEILDAGAIAVGIGSPLIQRSWLENKDREALTLNTKKLLSHVSHF